MKKLSPCRQLWLAIISAVFAILLVGCSAKKIEETHQNFMQLFFQVHDVDATVIIESMNSGERYVYNEDRAHKRYLPASTFKIPHAFIALEEHILASDTDVIEWDGKDRGYSEWNKDQTLASALKYSCVWVFQGFTNEISDATYLEYLQKLDYGNMKTGSDLSTFWLDGDLRISAGEQITFIKKLYREELPFTKEHYSYVKKNLLVDKSADYTMYAKTGMTLRVKEKIGWYVGYVESGAEVWLFAVNLTLRDKNDAGLRKEITYAAFEELGIINKDKEE